MKTLDLGATGRAVAKAIKFQRESLNLTYAALSKLLEDNGHRIPPLGLRRIEACARRVDVDDLIALSFALKIPPTELLTGLQNGPATGIPDSDYVGEEIDAWVNGDIFDLTSPKQLVAFWESAEASSRHWAEQARANAYEVDHGARKDRPGSFRKLAEEYEQRHLLAQDRLAYWHLRAGR